jgi:hypothetical protein
LTVEQSTTFDLVINQSREGANSASLIAHADEVIEWKR